MATTTVKLNTLQRHAVLAALIGDRGKTGTALEAIATKGAKEALDEAALRTAIEKASAGAEGNDAKIKAELDFVAALDAEEPGEDIAIGPIELEHIRTVLGKMDTAGKVPTNRWDGLWQVVFKQFEAGPYAAKPTKPGAN